MPAVTEQLQDVAYTTVGVNLLVVDAVAGEARKGRDEVLGRMGDTGARVEQFLTERELSLPENLEAHADKARKAATESLTDFRGRITPQTDKLVERLPEQVGEIVVSSRNQAWDFIGIKAPSKAKAKASSTAKKATTSAKKASGTAKKATKKSS